MMTMTMTTTTTTTTMAQVCLPGDLSNMRWYLWRLFSLLAGLMNILLHTDNSVASAMLLTSTNSNRGHTSLTPGLLFYQVIPEEKGEEDFSIPQAISANDLHNYHHRTVEDMLQEIPNIFPLQHQPKYQQSKSRSILKLLLYMKLDGLAVYKRRGTSLTLVKPMAAEKRLLKTSFDSSRHRLKHCKQNHSNKLQRHKQRQQQQQHQQQRGYIRSRTHRRSRANFSQYSRRSPFCDFDRASLTVLLEYLRTGRICGRVASPFRFGMIGKK